MASPRILVIYNEPVLPADHPDAGAEHDILDTVDNTVRVLAAAGFDTDRLGVNYDPKPLIDHLRRSPPDAVFNLFEGLATQTGTEISVAALLEWMNVPFTGCPSAALCLGQDKIRTKHLLTAAGVPTPDYAIIDGPPVPRWRRAWPAIVKPACQDASVGIEQESVVTSQRQLEERVGYVLETYGPPVVVERFVFGREFHVNLIEDAEGVARRLISLPLSEIAFQDTRPGRWPVYTFTAKWHVDSDEYKNTPLYTSVVIPDDALERLRKIGEKAFRLLQCRDYARLDVRMTEDGKFSVLEVNPNPYLNSLALVNGLKDIGRSHEQFIVDLARLAMARGGRAIPDGAIQVPVGVSSV